KNTASGYSIGGHVTYTGENGSILEIGALIYKDLTVTASRGAEFPVVTSLAGPVDVSGTLTVNPHCEIVSDGKLTLLASEDKNANVATLLDDAKITGDVNVQSFIKGG